MKENKTPQNDYFITGVIILVLLGSALHKAQPYLNYYYKLTKYYIYSFPFKNTLISLLVLGVFFSIFYFYKKIKNKKEAGPETFLGYHNKKPIYIPDNIRTTHTQVLGTTGSGKTESVILPWIIQDIKKGYGVLIIDGKSDSGFLDKLYSYTKEFKREKNFKLFSFANIPHSNSFNPLKGESAMEVAERVFSAFKFESEYYKNIQYKVFLNLVSLIREKQTPTFKLVHQLLTDRDELDSYLKQCTNPDLKKPLQIFIDLPQKEREARASGLESQLAHFVEGDCNLLFEDNNKSISINEALRQGQILYFQLPTMLYPFLAQATGRLVLQSIQSAISRRHLSTNKENKLFSVYLDDFQDYIYEGFGSLLNKSRSANVAMVFSHQSLGDLEKVSPAFRDVVLTNTNIKVIMRINDPVTAEYFAKSFGTKSGFKTTDQIETDFLGQEKTGKGTLRTAEEFVFHPNVFKQSHIGSGIVNIPSAYSVSQKEIIFPRLRDIPKVELPLVTNSIETKALPPTKMKHKSPIYKVTQKEGEKCL